jgi:hypothetical protein
MLSAGFEPTPRETDFDSVVVTTWLRPIIFYASIDLQVSSKSFWLCRCSDIKNLSFNRLRTCAAKEEQILIPFISRLGERIERYI